MRHILKRKHFVGGNQRTAWLVKHPKPSIIFRGESRAVATSRMERFMIIVNGFQPLTIITKRSIWDVKQP